MAPELYEEQYTEKVDVYRCVAGECVPLGFGRIGKNNAGFA